MTGRVCNDLRVWICDCFFIFLYTSASTSLAERAHTRMATSRNDADAAVAATAGERCVVSCERGSGIGLDWIGLREQIAIA